MASAMLMNRFAKRLRRIGSTDAVFFDAAIVGVTMANGQVLGFYSSLGGNTAMSDSRRDPRGDNLFSRDNMSYMRRDSAVGDLHITSQPYKSAG